MANKSKDEAEQPAEQPGLVTLTFIGAPWSGTLTIGVVDYAIADGVVRVPAELVPAANQAGFV